MCSQTGMLKLLQGSVHKSPDSFSALWFEGLIETPSSTCTDLYVQGWAVHIEGFFFSNGGYVRKTGSFEQDDCAGSCLGYSIFWIDAAQPNRLSGRTDCSFRYMKGQGWWEAEGLWVAERQP